MSYEIYYDRAFISVGSNYIPLVNSGSSNCFEYGFGGRSICEKAWNVLNWKRGGRFMFTAAEVGEIARDYDEYNQESGMMYKSRHRAFDNSEMERWIINGMKRAYTVEEYVSFGNSLYVLDYSKGRSSEWERHYFATTDELLGILGRLKDTRSLEIKLGNNREAYRPKGQGAPRSKRRTCDLDSYYTLLYTAERKPYA